MESNWNADILFCDNTLLTSTSSYEET